MVRECGVWYKSSTRDQLDLSIQNYLIGGKVFQESSPARDGPA
jgi:hypothetical protein